MDLYIRQKVFTLADKYDITDENENPVFRVEGELSLIHIFRNISGD